MRTYTIHGETVKAVKNSFSCNDRLNERTTSTFTVFEPHFEIDIGMEVLVHDDSTLIFAGTVENLTESGDTAKMVSVSCVDYSQLIDKRIVFDTFENKTAGFIARSLISRFFAEEGITEGNIQDGPVISKAVFNYNNGNVAMNYIQETTNLNWTIDYDKKLNLFERSTYAAPFSLTDKSFNYAGLQVKKNRGDYRNRQYVRAGQDETQEIVKEKPTPKPDGISKTFVMRLPIARKPRIYINGVEVSQEDIGVNGLHSEKKFYFAFNSNTITQDEVEPVLVDGDLLEVTYYGLYPIIIVAENSEEIDDRKSLESGTGIYENVIQEDGLDTREAAFEFADGKLEKYGIIPRVITFNTHVHGLKAGQLLPIQNTNMNLDDSFLIESVTIRANGSETLYSVKCLDGSTLGGWEKFFNSLIKSNKKLVIRDNEVLVLLNNIKEKQSWSESQEDTVYACFVPRADEIHFYGANEPLMMAGLYPSDDLIPC